MYESELSLDHLYNYTLKRSFFYSFFSLLYLVIAALSFTRGNNSVGALYVALSVAMFLVVLAARYDFEKRTVNSQYITLVAKTLSMLFLVIVIIFTVIIGDGIFWLAFLFAILLLSQAVYWFRTSFEIIRRLQQGENPRDISFSVNVVSPTVVHGTLSPIPVPAYATPQTSVYSASVQVQGGGNAVPVVKGVGNAVPVVQGGGNALPVVQGGGNAVPVVQGRIV